MIVRRLENSGIDPAMWQDAWSKARISDVTLHCDAVSKVVSKLAWLYSNGEVIFKQYKIEGPSGSDRVSNTLKNFNLWDHLESLLKHPNVKEKVPEISETAGGMGLELITRFQFIAEVAHALHLGGAYSPLYEVSGEDALNRAKNLFEAMYGKGGYQYQPLTICRASNNWSDWFYDVAWDSAWFLYDSKRQVVTVFVATDTD